MCATHGAAYLKRYGDRVPAEHRRVLQLLADCGTGRLGRVRYRCAQCAAAGRDATHHTNASCGNRHCPNCQTTANAEWCAEQTTKLLPCEYFFVTFTVPSQLRPFIRAQQRVCYDALLKAAAFALQTALADPKYCGADRIGFTSVLHTFGRDLSYHPHVHVLIPGGGISSDGNWRSTRPGFFAPVKVLSKLFRTEFERLLMQHAHTTGLDAADFRREFVCDVEAVGDGIATLKYLSRYIFRTAITNRRILSMTAGDLDTSTVTFSYRRSGEHQDRTMPLSANAFLHRFLQHVLPRRFQRLRHYGFLSRRSHTHLDELRAVILKSLADIEPDLELEDWTPPVLRPRAESNGPLCPNCGAILRFESFERIRPPPLWLRTPTTANSRSFTSL